MSGSGRTGLPDQAISEHDDAVGRGRRLDPVVRGLQQGRIQPRVRRL
jgi:hypothetical protein